MIIDEAACLHKGVGNSWSAKFKARFFEVF